MQARTDRGATYGRRVRILSIDGGGIRGLVPALVLAELEARTGRPVAELFDLVAGTSTGGILACALCRPDPLPARELVGLYRTEGPVIFRRSLGRRITSVEGLVDERHSAGPLEEVLARYLGTTRMSEATTRLLVPAYDLEAREPRFFKSWRADLDAPMAAVARATSAAPTYFEPAHLDGRWLIDGGLVANSPAMCAYAEAARLALDAELGPVRVVSLGTGRQTRAIPGPRATGWGLIGWARPVIDVVFDGVTDAVDYQLRELLGPDAYDRFEVDLDRASDALDDAGERNLALLAEQAAGLIATRSEDLDRVVAGLLA